MSVPLDPETEKTVDSIIDRLLSVRGNKPGKATQVDLQGKNALFGDCERLMYYSL